MGGDCLYVRVKHGQGKDSVGNGDGQGEEKKNQLAAKPNAAGILYTHANTNVVHISTFDGVVQD